MKWAVVSIVALRDSPNINTVTCTYLVCFKVRG